MKSRNHDKLMSGYFGYTIDYYDEERHPYAETIRTAVERILKMTRADAIDRENSSTVWRVWPEDDKEGLRYKVSNILRLFQSRPATGAVEEFFLSVGRMTKSEYVKVIIWDHSVKYPTPDNPRTRSQVYHVDDLPEKYRGYELPYANNNVQILPLFTFGVGD